MAKKKKSVFNGHRCEFRNMDEVAMNVRFDENGRGRRISAPVSKAKHRPKNWITPPDGQQ